MRFVTIAGLLVFWAAVIPQDAAAGSKPGNQEFTPLFNGNDLAGFKTYLDPKAGDADPAKTWMVENGVIRCTGKPSGYFYTDKSYSNYVLRYDWRYPAGSDPSSNSGCLVHIHAPHALWPQAVEPQGATSITGNSSSSKSSRSSRSSMPTHTKRPLSRWANGIRPRSPATRTAPSR